MSLPIRAVLTGQVRPFARGRMSAIAKQPVDGPVEVGPLGLVGDTQADGVAHGGPDMAIHHYPFEHYASWAAEIVQPDGPPGIDDLLSRPGAFGENVSTMGLTEADICVGDLWQAGSALLEVSQARQPCWKLNLRFDTADMARRVQETGRSGWYYRVREGGRIGPGDALVLRERPWPDWPLSRLLHALYRDTMDRNVLAGIADLAPLSASWRLLAERRLASRAVEDWAERLQGDTSAHDG
ncbi:MAG: MOSC domain-containing protein [Pseudomonadota bacterium]